MGLKGKLICEFEIRSSAEDLYHQVRHKPHHIAGFSELVDDCELHDGEYGQHGSTICWRYKQLDGKTDCKCKQIVEFDEEKKTIVMKVVGGDVLEDCKSCVVTFNNVAQEGDTDLIKLTLDYERLNENSPHPINLLDVIVNACMHVEAEHVKSAASSKKIGTSA